MTAPTDSSGVRPERGETETSAGWHALGAIGLTLFVVGVVDILLAWWPPRFGSPEWEFGTISATLNNMPVPSMGLAMLLAHAAADRRRGQLLLIAAWSVGVVLFLLVAAAFYGLDVPLALKAVQDPVIRHGLKAGIVKGIASLVAYLGFHLFAVIFAVLKLRRQ